MLVAFWRPNISSIVRYLENLNYFCERITDETTHRDKPKKAILEELKSVPTAFIADAMKGLGLNVQALYMPDLGALSSVRGKTIVGTAMTMRVLPHYQGEGPLYSPHYNGEVMQNVAEGDIVVIEAHGQKLASWGEFVSKATIMRKGIAAVIDGYVRDVDRIFSLGFHVYCRGRTMVANSLISEIVDFNKPIYCDGAQVRPDDIIVADNDGVLVIPRARLKQVAQRVKDVFEVELEESESINKGLGGRELMKMTYRKKYGDIRHQL